MKKRKMQSPKCVPATLDDRAMQCVRGGGGLGKVVMDSNVLPT